MPVIATCETCGATAPMVHQSGPFATPAGWFCKHGEYCLESDRGRVWCSVRCLSHPETGVGLEDRLLGEIGYARLRIEEFRAKGIAVPKREVGVKRLCERYREKYGREVPEHIEITVE